MLSNKALQQLDARALVAFDRATASGDAYAQNLVNEVRAYLYSEDADVTRARGLVVALERVVGIVQPSEKVRKPATLPAQPLNVRPDVHASLPANASPPGVKVGLVDRTRNWWSTLTTPQKLGVGAGVGLGIYVVAKAIR